ncbi:hypothetical protein J4434_02965 [Candidatus Woesearchaeota archaeon]|nr:hypothetical protein [Candidatus Woesearchaeota archaeon]
MAILKQDINFNLIFLIGVTIAATVLLTLYFVYSMSNVNVDYNTMEKDLKITKANLTLTTKNLNQCANQQLNMSLELNESKKIEEKSREEYNKIYEDTEIELTKTQTGLKDTKDQLDKTLTELKDTTNDLNAKKSELSTAQNEIESLEKKVNNLEEKEQELENLKDDMKSCKTNNDLECYKGLT